MREAHARMVIGLSHGIMTGWTCHRGLLVVLSWCRGVGISVLRLLKRWWLVVWLLIGLRLLHHIHRHRLAEWTLIVVVMKMHVDCRSSRWAELEQACGSFQETFSGM